MSAFSRGIHMSGTHLFVFIFYVVSASLACTSYAFLHGIHMDGSLFLYIFIGMRIDGVHFVSFFRGICMSGVTLYASFHCIQMSGGHLVCIFVWFACLGGAMCKHFYVVSSYPGHTLYASLRGI